ncbi:MAG: hypothetical protein IKV32_05040 [Muribaculaceae bacterium]|nr:hypothetical protein [Muribaculaceae bacterium]
MRNFVIVSFFLIFSIFFNANISANENTKPDFAFPLQVSQQAEYNLKKALKDNDGNAVVKSLIEYAVAIDKINSDSIQHTITKIESVTSKEKNPCTKALLNSLLLEIYSNVYNSNKGIIAKREKVGTDTPTDITEWSKVDFTNKINTLCNEILIDSDALKKAQLKDYENLINHNDQTFIFYPTLYDFAIYHITSIVSDISISGNPQMPRIDNIDAFLFSNEKNIDPYINLVSSLYRKVITFHAHDTASLINWEINRLNYELNNYRFSPNITYIELIDQYTQALNHIYKKYEQSEYANNALIEIADESIWNVNSNRKSPYTKHELYKLLSSRLKRFPAYYNNCEIKNTLKTLSQKTLDVTYPFTITPNDTMTINIENANNHSYLIEIHHLPDDATNPLSNNYDYGTVGKMNLDNAKLVQSFSVSCTEEIPFEKKDTIKTVLTEPGYYTVVAYIDSTTKATNSNFIRCTKLHICPIFNEHFDDNRIFVLNPKTGAPVTDANFSIYERNSKSQKSFIAKKDGKFDLKFKTGNYIITANKGNDIFATSKTLYFNYERDNEETLSANIFTSLPIYHPGDSIHWSAVVYSQKGENAQLCKNRTFTVTLRDANYMEVDTIMATTDCYGRIEGKFHIPTNRMTGNYSINIIGEFNRVVGRNWVMVSDYKLPTFAVTISNFENLQNGEFAISGNVKSFSDFAIENATVNLSLSEIFSSNKHNYPNTVTTDANGNFRFVIPESFITANIPANKSFKVTISATSITGESQTASRKFSIGKQFYIVSTGNTLFEASKNVNLNAKIQNINGDPINGKIYYTLTNNKKEVIKEGSFETASPVVDWSKVPSSEYNIALYSLSPTATDTLNFDITIYRLTDATPPQLGLWIQHNEYTITQGNSVDIYYSSSFDSAEILYLLYDDNKILEQRWIKAKKGIHKTRVFMPQNVSKAKLTLYTVNNYSSTDCSTTILRANGNNFIKITAESFRDKIIPGDEEEWRFSVTDNRGNGVGSAMIFDMYSLALENIKKHNFQLNFPSKATPYIFRYSYFFPHQNSIPISEKLSLTSCPQLIEPLLYTYNYRIGDSRKYRNRNMVLYETKGSNFAQDEEVFESDSQIVAYGTSDRAEKKKLSYAVEVVDDTAVKDVSNIPLRENETPLAFFSPMLTTDTLGNLTFSFTVPNANTTWRFNAIAFNDNMEVATFARNVIANKPLMVQPNMPRFLRRGDESTIKASMMNNSETPLVITTVVELFNPATAKTISTHRQTDTIAASQSAIASINLTVPTDATMIGYRIKSYSDNFRDGEQSLIPILPASSPVVESTTFYMGANEKSTTIQLPTISENAHVTLEFCENPTWYAVTALPGLRKGESRTAISAINSIYSAAIADGIMRKNPQIANALYQWQHSDKNDSTLVSMLSRNEEVKNMLLNATPWVQDANNDTERMARLALLFNKKEIKNTIDKNIHLLATLQRNGGGWAWIAESEKASTWATLSILEKIGHLKRLGYLPNSKDLNSMVENAIKYIDAEFAQQFKKSPNGNYSQYVLIRDMFSEYRQSTAAQRVTNATIQQIINNWKAYDLGGKAIAAMILNDNGYSSTALKILSSISQFAQSTPSKGMWWPSIVNSLDNNIDKNLVQANILDAFYQINPSNKNIDLMRQWLIINKEANDWGNSIATSYVIYTLLNTGSNWTKPAVGCEISLNGEQITPSHFETITGYLRADISSLSPSGKKLTIAKHGNNPSWGAIYRQYEATMKDITAVAGNDISINKSILKQVGDAWLPTDTFAVGDKVRIRLTIKAYRDIEYISISDERAACFEPIEQLPKPIFAEGICFYRENRDEATNIFVSSLPKGTYLLTYDMYVNNEGDFSSGIATIQSQYAPQITAHSAGEQIVIK